MDHDDGLGIVLPGYYGGSGKFFVKKSIWQSPEIHILTHTKKIEKIA